MSGFLRIVGQDLSLAASPERQNSPPEHSGQFRFNFEEEPVRRIVLVPMDEVDGFLLHHLVFELTPTAVMDLRHAVRFDLPGTSRHRFFGDLRLARTLYIREPIEWHALQTNTFATDSTILPARLFHEIVERQVGHFLLLLPNKQSMLMMASALNLALTQEQTHGWRIEQVT